MRKLWPLLVASTVGFVILCSLGVWQVNRLSEKTQLIAALDARMNRAPITLAQALERHARGEDIEYLKVETSGRANPAHALAKVSSLEGGPGWQIIEPFISREGIFILVYVGVAPDKNIVAVNGDQSIAGIVRTHNKGRGYFDNDNDEAGNVWYWWDVPAMLAAAVAPVNAKVAPFILQKLPGPTNAGSPFPEKPKVELNNNHLGYAFTWFGLAMALLAVTGFFTWSVVKKD